MQFTQLVLRNFEQINVDQKIDQYFSIIETFSEHKSTTFPFSKTSLDLFGAFFYFHC